MACNGMCHPSAKAIDLPRWILRASFPVVAMHGYDEAIAVVREAACEKGLEVSHAPTHDGR